MVTVSEITRVRASVCILLDSGEKFWLREADLPGTGLRAGLSLGREDFLQKSSSTMKISAASGSVTGFRRVTGLP